MHKRMTVEQQDDWPSEWWATDMLDGTVTGKVPPKGWAVTFDKLDGALTMPRAVLKLPPDNPVPSGAAVEEPSDAAATDAPGVGGSTHGDGAPSEPNTEAEAARQFCNRSTENILTPDKAEISILCAKYLFSVNGWRHDALGGSLHRLLCIGPKDTPNARSLGHNSSPTTTTRAPRLTTTITFGSTVSRLRSVGLLKIPGGGS